MVDSSWADEDNADRLEWACAAASDGYLAWADVKRELRLATSEAEAVETYADPGEEVPEEGWRDIEPFERRLDQWVEVLSHRDQACGPDDSYPFEITQEGLQLRDEPSAAYLFQLLVSLGITGDDDAGTPAYKLFEELSAVAAGRYLGDSGTAVVFGWPRQDLPAGFRDAVTHLVDLLREGKACGGRRNLNQSNDDGLDVVAWRDFPDRRASKLILFGQCAVGRHWREKTHELRPKSWCKRNIAGAIAVDPIPAFFVPRALSDTDASNAGVDQLLLDRCRISSLCGRTLDDPLEQRLQDWIDTSLKSRRHGDC